MPFELSACPRAPRLLGLEVDTDEASTSLHPGEVFARWPSYVPTGSQEDEGVISLDKLAP